MTNESRDASIAAAAMAAEERDPVRAQTDRIVAEHADLVYSLAKRLTRNDEEARDLFQESWLRILRGLPGFEGRASLRTWICQVVINCDRNRRRWWARWRRNLSPIPLDAVDPPPEHRGAEPADASPGPERRLLSSESRRRIESALRELPAEQRMAVLLRDVEGMGYDEIAAAMGIAIGTVKSKISRGRAALRERLADLVEGVAP
jgi:RNA polymerase sigma-70 factor (ECF subfamily)